MEQASQAPQPDQANQSPQIPQSLDLDEAVEHYASQLDRAEPDSASDSGNDSVPSLPGESDVPEDEGAGAGDVAAAENAGAAKEKEPTEPAASKWASLRKREQAFEEKRQAWQAEQAEKIKAVEEFERLKARAKDDPFTALRALGHEDGRKFLEMIAETGGTMSPEQQRIYELEQQVQEDRKAREEAKAQAEQQAQSAQQQAQLKAWHDDIAKYISETPEFADSLANVPDIAPAVFNVMQEHYAETQERMPYKEAVTKVSEQVETNLDAMLSQLVGNKRGQELLARHAAKLNKPAQASKKAPGITQRISNSTGVKRQEPKRFDDALGDAANWLNSQFKK